MIILPECLRCRLTLCKVYFKNEFDLLQKHCSEKGDDDNE